MKKTEFNLDPPTDDEIALGSAVSLPQAVGIANAAGVNVSYGSVYRGVVEGKIPATRSGSRLYLKAEAVVPAIQNFTLDATPIGLTVTAATSAEASVGSGWMGRAEFANAISSVPQNHYVYSAALPGGQLEVRKGSGGRIPDPIGVQALYNVMGVYDTPEQAEEAARAAGGKIRGQKRADPESLRVSEVAELLRARVGVDPRRAYALVRSAALGGNVPTSGTGRSLRISRRDAEDFIGRYAQTKEKK